MRGLFDRVFHPLQFEQHGEVPQVQFLGGQDKHSQIVELTADRVFSSPVQKLKVKTIIITYKTLESPTTYSPI